MKIGVIGLGYVGLSVSLGLAEIGHEIYGYEINKEKANKLSNSIMPIYEEGMQEVLERSIQKNFFIVNQIETVIQNTEAIYICVPSPSNENESIDLSYVIKVAEDIGEKLKYSENYPIFILKSTVIPGTTRKIKEILIEKSGKNNDDLEIAMVPEFLRQGTALKDFLYPDRMVFGVENKNSKAEKILLKMFETSTCKKIVVDIETAEFCKYASNSYLALKISFANELANTIDSFNLKSKNHMVNVDKIVEIMGMDKRINPVFLGAGPGFGGSCFPKDVKALTSFSRSMGTPFTLLETVTEVNKKQAKVIVDHSRKLLGGIRNKKIGIFGLAFKPNTDDTRDSPAKEIINLLLKEECKIFGWDPKAEANMRKEYPNLVYHDKLEEFDNDKLDLAIVITDWDEIKEFFRNKSRTGYKIIDTRRIGIKADIVIGNTIKI